MSTVRDDTLLSSGLGPDGVRGFRAAMRHRPSRHPDLILPDDASVARMGPVALLEFRRGVLVAQQWWRGRIAAGVAARAGTIEARGGGHGMCGAGDAIVRAIAVVEGFAVPEPGMVHEAATSVLTHDAGYIERDVVTFFHADGPNGILSPTHPTSIIHGDRTWTSVEALYQAQKHSDPGMRERIRMAPDAITAKAIARMQESDVWGMRSHFTIGRRIAMVRAQMLRASQDDAFREALRDTLGREIVEHTTGDEPDTRWGVVGTGALRGWNLQGRILRRVRDMIVTERLTGHRG